MRFLAKLTVLLVGLPLLYLGWTAADIWQTSKRDERSQAQAIVVMGAAQYDGRPSPVFRARLDHAGELEQDGVAPLGVLMRPYQQPHPPIAIAGVNRASYGLGQAGERGWIPLSTNFLPPSALAGDGTDAGVRRHRVAAT